MMIMRVSDIHRNKDECELNFHVFENMKIETLTLFLTVDKFKFEKLLVNFIVFYKKYVFACAGIKEMLNIENLRALLVSLIFKAFIDLRT